MVFQSFGEHGEADNADDHTEEIAVQRECDTNHRRIGKSKQQFRSRGRFPKRMGRAIRLHGGEIIKASGFENRNHTSGM